MGARERRAPREVAGVSGWEVESNCFANGSLDAEIRCGSDYDPSSEARPPSETRGRRLIVALQDPVVNETTLAPSRRPASTQPGRTLRLPTDKTPNVHSSQEAMTTQTRRPNITVISQLAYALVSTRLVTSGLRQ